MLIWNVNWSFQAVNNSFPAVLESYINPTERPMYLAVLSVLFLDH